MSLYTAETRRLTKRRFTRFFVLGTLVVLAVVAAGMFLANERPTPQRRAEAVAQAQREYQLGLQSAAEEKQRCAVLSDADRAQQYPAGCDNVYQPAPSDYEADWYLPPTFDFREQFGYLVTTLAALLAVAAFVIGASSVGAEWSSGGMMNLLLWRPRRLEVLGTKLVALLTGLTVLTVLTSVIWTGLFAVIASTRGTLAGMTSGAWLSFALMEVRGLVLVLVAGAIGFGLASLGRHTAMALGAAIGAIVVFQFGLGTVLALAGVRWIELYLVPTWTQAWLAKSYEITDYESCNYSGSSGCTPDTLTITWPMAGSLLTVLLVLVVGAAMWTMRSRDIT